MQMENDEIMDWANEDDWEDDQNPQPAKDQNGKNGKAIE